MEYILTIISIFISFILFQFFLIQLLKKLREPREKPQYETLMNILIDTIERELHQVYKLEYELRNLKMIPKFEEELERLTVRILNCFSIEFLNELEYYHTRQYIITFVTKNVETFLIEFTNNKKIKTK